MAAFQIGTYTMAISAKAMNKPFYVVAESFKFARLYPLNQEDVPNQFKVGTNYGLSMGPCLVVSKDPILIIFCEPINHCPIKLPN